jgi:CubicO group peptidase (beta-lactamase class C family)
MKPSKILCFFIALAFVPAFCLAQQAYPLHKILGKTNENSKGCSAVVNPKRIAKSLNPVPLQEPDNTPPSGSINAFKRIGEAISTAGLVVVRGNKIVYEKYADGAMQDDLMVSFSRAKSLISLAVGRMYCDKRIESLDDPLEKYLVGLKDTRYGKSTISSILEMSSGATPGLPHGETAPGETQRWLKGEKSLLQSFNEYNKEFSSEGTYAYKNLDTIALTMLLQKVYGVGVEKWFFDTVWNPVGAESDALWALDKDQLPIASSFLFATNRDWARVGLYINRTLRGEIGDACLKEYLTAATSKRKTPHDREYWGYGYQIWTNQSSDSRKQISWFRGVAGQLVGLHPQSNSVIVLTALNDFQTTAAAKAFIDWAYQ